MLVILEVVLTELDIIIVHSKTELVNEGMETCLIELSEAFESLNSSRYLIVCIKSLYCFEGCFTALHGVDDV